ncbi:hypothetical protein DFS34DRAFT_668163, partial [Phlyctochytrium arcticum]
MAGSPPKNQSPLRRGGRFVSPNGAASSRKSKTPDCKQTDAFAPGCIKCRTKSSPQFYHRDLALLSHIQAEGIKFHFNTDAGHEKASLCKTCWVFLDRNHPHPLLRSTQEQPRNPFADAEIISDVGRQDQVNVELNLESATGAIAINKTFQSTSTQTTCSSSLPVELVDQLHFNSGVQKLADSEFEGKMPFSTDLEGFIEHLDTCDQLATKTAVDLHLSANDWKLTLSERQRRMIASLTIQKAAFPNPSINFMKDAVLSTTLGISDSSRRVLSSFNLTYSPDVAKEKMKMVNENAYEELTREMGSGTVVPVIRMDDFNRVSIHGTPGSANSGKFSTCHTQANLAVKFYPKGESFRDENDRIVQQALPMPFLARPYVDWAALNSDAKKKMYVAPIFHQNEMNATIASISYGDRLVSNPKFRSLYRFDMSTTAAELKQFHIFGAVPNRMKSAEDLKVLMVDVSKFVKHYKDGVVWIVGDFYVWQNVMKFLWAQSRTPMTQDHKWLKDLLFPWPDGMHIALNAQQALIEHNFAIFMPIWSAAFPGFAVQLVKLRPVRRMMLLTMAFLAWKRNRVAIIALVKNCQKELPPFQQVATQSLVRLFDEELPLDLDAATAMAAGNVSLYKEVMQRLLPVFIRYRKKNYVTIVVHILSVIQDIESRGNPDLLRAFQSKLPLASSEDLEVFHSLLRAGSVLLIAPSFHQTPRL